MDTMHDSMNAPRLKPLQSFRRYLFIDWATQGYMVLVALLILLFHGQVVPQWRFLCSLHAAGLVLVHGVIVLHGRFPGNRGLDFLRHFYPILLYTGFYAETGLLHQMFMSGFLDGYFFRIEKALFGMQPGLEFMYAMPQRWFSEILFASYFSYYLMVVGIGLFLLLRNRRQFFHFLSVVSFVFYICYLCYIFLPVIGPRILYRHLGVNFTLPPELMPAVPLTCPASVESGVFFQIMLWIYDHFETPGAAFPSSHVAIALTTLYFSFLYLKPIRWIHLVMAGLLCVSTVYGRYHYVVDVFAGMLVALLLIPVGNRLFFKFHPDNGDGKQAAPTR